LSDATPVKVYEGPKLGFVVKGATSLETYTFYYKALNNNTISAASTASVPTYVFPPKYRLYVSDHAQHRVIRFHANGTFDRNFVLPSAGGLHKPWGITEGPTATSDLYVSSEGQGGVFQFERCSGRDLGMLAYAPGQPRGIAFHTNQAAQSHLYVAERYNNRVLKFDAATGNELGTFANVISPWGLRFQSLPGSSKTDLFITSDMDNNVFRTDGENGASISKYLDTPVDAASGLDFSGTGHHLFVTGPYTKTTTRFVASTTKGTASGIYGQHDEYASEWGTPEGEIGGYEPTYSNPAAAYRCQGLTHHNQSLFVACGDQIRVYDADTGEFSHVFGHTVSEGWAEGNTHTRGEANRTVAKITPTLKGMKATFIRWILD